MIYDIYMHIYIYIYSYNNFICLFICKCQHVNKYIYIYIGRDFLVADYEQASCLLKGERKILKSTSERYLTCVTEIPFQSQHQLRNLN